MNKLLLKTKKRLQYLIAILMIFISIDGLIGQINNRLEARAEVIGYNEPFSFALPEVISWELKNESGSVMKNGEGELKDFIFNKPGNYKLMISENKNHNATGCEHAHYPEEIEIEVNPIKLNFDFNTIQFSEDIVGGKTLSGSIVKINANFSTYDNSVTEYKYNQGFTTFGVGSTITGKLKNGEISLIPGVNTLEFELDGAAEQGNNIQINFVDFNGEVQPYSLTPKMQ